MPEITSFIEARLLAEVQDPVTMREVMIDSLSEIGSVDIGRAMPAMSGSVGVELDNTTYIG